MDFSEKPPGELRDKLKSEGWKWSPTGSVWQRLRNDAARVSVDRIFKTGGLLWKSSQSEEPLEQFDAPKVERDDILKVKATPIPEEPEETKAKRAWEQFREKAKAKIKGK